MQSLLKGAYDLHVHGAPVEAFSRHVERLALLDFDPRELRAMLCDNPKRLVTDRRHANRQGE